MDPIRLGFDQRLDHHFVVLLNTGGAMNQEEVNLSPPDVSNIPLSQAVALQR